jgi:hypothetical protein
MRSADVSFGGNTGRKSADWANSGLCHEQKLRPATQLNQTGLDNIRLPDNMARLVF